jgi:hypothetical protein
MLLCQNRDRVICGLFGRVEAEDFRIHSAMPGIKQERRTAWKDGRPAQSIYLLSVNVRT